MAAREGTESGVEVEVVELGPTRRRLELRGPLPIGWAGRLASALAAQEVSILAGRARELGASGWDAQFDVELREPSQAMGAAVVVAALAPDATAARPVGGLELRAHRVFAMGDGVLVELDAADCRGFLDRVLRLFAFHGLFPREMTVETVDGRVHDSFRLHGIHGAGPERATIRALDARLRGMRIGLRPGAREGQARPVH